MHCGVRLAPEAASAISSGVGAALALGSFWQHFQPEQMPLQHWSACAAAVKDPSYTRRGLLTGRRLAPTVHLGAPLAALGHRGRRSDKSEQQHYVQSHRARCFGLLPWHACGEHILQQVRCGGATAHATSPPTHGGCFGRCLGCMALCINTRATASCLLCDISDLGARSTCAGKCVNIQRIPVRAQEARRPRSNGHGACCLWHTLVGAINVGPRLDPSPLQAYLSSCYFGRHLWRRPG